MFGWKTLLSFLKNIRIRMYSLNKKINKIDDFWLWTINKLASGLRANIWYNNEQPFGLAGFINDFSSRMIGYATLRQIRVKNGNNI